MIDNARVAALTLFATVWAKSSLISRKFSPVTWNRVVLISLALLLISAFCLVRVSRTTYREEPGTEYSDAQLTLQAKKMLPLRDVTDRPSWRAMTDRAQAHPTKITKVSTRSSLKRARRASSVRYKRTYRNTDKYGQLAANLKSGRTGSSLSTAAINAGNPSAEPTIALELTNRDLTWSQVGNIITRASNAALDRSRSSLDPDQSDSKFAKTQPKTDTETSLAWPMTDGSGAVGKNVYSSRMPVGSTESCDDCKFDEVFLSAWSVGDPAVLVNNSHILKGTSTTNTFCTGAEFGDPADPADPNCAEVLVPVPLAVDNSAYRRNLLSDQDEPSNVCRDYTNDGIKFRIHHGGPVATYVHQRHAHQWLIATNSEQDTYLDGQMITPGASYTLEMTFNGSGNRNMVVGDSIFHCHFYPHFAAGMWAIWRKGDTLEVDPQFYAPAIYRPFDERVWKFPLRLTYRLSDFESSSGYANGGSRSSEPLFFRGSSGVIVDYWDTNLAGNYYGAADFQVRTPTDLWEYVHLAKFDVTSSENAADSFNSDRTLRTVFTHDHFGSWTNSDENTLTPLMRAYVNDSPRIRTLVGAHESAHVFTAQIRGPISASFAHPRPVFTFLFNFTNRAVDNDLSNQNPNTAVLSSQSNTPIVQDRPCRSGAIAKTEGDKLKTEEPKSRDPQSSAYVVDVPRDFPKALLANANEKTVTVLFWVFLFSTMVNTLSTTSAIILAWMSNNRARAELVLKQADALREARERELRIKELELRLAQLERQASAPSGLIVVAS